MTEYTGKVKKLDGQRMIIDIHQTINMDRLHTMYFGYTGDREVSVEFIDPRRFTGEQRKFYFAMLNDIFIYTGEPVEMLHEIFKNKYLALTGKYISLNNNSMNTVSEVCLLCDIVINFIFEFDIPFKQGYEILPQNVEWYLYKCLTNRKCCLCGKKADIHHATHLVGMGNDRRKHDHINSTFMALCREHHNLIHNIGLTEFMERYKVYPIKLNEETIKRLNI